MGIILVTKNNMKRCLHHKGRFLIAFLLPIIICIIAGFFTTDKKPILRIGFLTNMSDTADENFDILKNSKTIKIEYADSKTYHTDLIMGKYHVILDYRNLSEEEEFKLITLKNNSVKTSYKEIISSLLRNSLPMSGKIEKTALTESERSLALITTMFMIMATINGAIIIKDKITGTFLRFLYAPQRKRNYSIGNGIYIFMITFIQVFISLIAMKLIVKNHNLNVLEILFLDMFIAVISTVFALFVCKICKNDVQANITASSMATILSLFGGTFISIQYMPHVLKLISVISPIRWVIEISKLL